MEGPSINHFLFTKSSKNRNRVTFKLHNLARETLSELLALTCSSNARLYEQATGLGIFSADDIRSDSFHYHVKELQLRELGGMGLSHAKRAQPAGARFSLANCRMRSEPRLVFSVRLVPFSYRADGVGTNSEYGVLALVQELCSGFMRAEILETGCATRQDLCALTVDKVAEMVARTISIPKLKISALHFPTIPYSTSVRPSHTSGLIGAMLGYRQQASAREKIEEELQALEAMCKQCDWAGKAHLLRPQDGTDWCFADFPKMEEARTLALDRPYGRAWRLHTVAREINQRVDRWNCTSPGEAPAPLIKLWLAKIKYHKTTFNTEDDANRSLARLLKEAAHRRSPLTNNALNAVELYERLIG